MTDTAAPFDDVPEEPTKPYSLDNLPVLSDEQKAYADAHWEDPIGDLAKQISGDPKQDGRSYWGIAVKQYLAGMGKIVKTSKKIVKGELELTQEQCQFIEVNHAVMKVMEMTKLLFPDEPKIFPVSREFKAVYKYAKNLADSEIDIFDEPVESREYKSPVSIGSLIGRVNGFVSNPKDHTKALYDPNHLKPFDEKNLRALIGFLKTVRFRNQASSYVKFADRELFESTFVRLVYDKASEITAGEADLYISAASKTISLTRIERSIEGMQERVDSALAGEDDKDGNKTKLSMTLVELINESHTKANQYAGQIKDLLKALEGERSKRVDSRNSRNSSILNLFDAWIEEESRNQIIAMGMEEKDADRNEIKRLKNVTDVLGLIAGQTEEEASN